VSPGQLYATPLDHQAFYQTNDQVYAASWLFSYPGNSGGPLCVLYTNSLYYPVAVYLGTLFNDGVPYASVVRAIDSNVVNLITLASDFGDTGTNNSGGGVINVIPGQGLANNPWVLEVTIAPSAAFQAGGAWKLTTLSDAYYSTQNPSALALTSNNPVQLQFKQIPGWNVPTNQLVSVATGSVVSLTVYYTRAQPLIQTVKQSGNSFTFTWSAPTNQTYQIQYTTNLTQSNWTALGGAFMGTNSTMTTSEPIGADAQQFYRVMVLP